MEHLTSPCLSAQMLPILLLRLPSIALSSHQVLVSEKSHQQYSTVCIRKTTWLPPYRALCSCIYRKARPRGLALLWDGKGWGSWSPSQEEVDPQIGIYKSYGWLSPSYLPHGSPKRKAKPHPPMNLLFPHHRGTRFMR